MGMIFQTNDITIMIHNLFQDIFLLFSIVNNQGLVENIAKTIIYSIYSSPCYIYSGKIIVHLFPWCPWQNQVYEPSLMDLEKYEHNFHFPFIFLFDQSPLYNRTWTLREATACWRFLLTFSLQDMQTQCKYNNYLVK